MLAEEHSNEMCILNMKAVQGVCRFASSLANKGKFWLFFKEVDPFPLLGIGPEPIMMGCGC